MTPGSDVFTRRYPAPDAGLLVAVKDNFDMAGEITGAGCRAVMESAAPAPADAACLAGVRRAQASGTAQIIGRTVMDELAAGATGINPWTGTPQNPRYPGRIPGGSSSGSAVAVATGSADIGFGTDTGGSVRIPAACCGIAGLKTSIGRVPTDGVHPLSQTLDVVGVMARTSSDLAAGMALLEPGFSIPAAGSRSVGRIRLSGNDRWIDAAVDDALAASGMVVRDVELDDWSAAHEATYTILITEAWHNHQHLLAAHPDGVSPLLTAQLVAGGRISSSEVGRAHRFRRYWIARLNRLLEEVDLLCVPTLSTAPALLDDAETIDWGTFARTMPVNLAGSPRWPCRYPWSARTSRHRYS
ncbi:amidase [Nakamurella lactea]|uniref:amidase n=1 Tax=Nakamurella lactea TaxID=459515 RepID=UPI0003F6CED5|nr:amidase [Nakamurella lactea]